MKTCMATPEADRSLPDRTTALGTAPCGQVPAMSGLPRRAAFRRAGYQQSSMACDRVGVTSTTSAYMPACTIKPADLQRQIRVVGRDLVQNYGKKKYYSPLEVRNANRRASIYKDYTCWSYAFFNDRPDFDAYHATLGEICDYASIKSEMISSIDVGGALVSAFDVGMSWLDLPSVDWSSLLDFDLDPF